MIRYLGKLSSTEVNIAIISHVLDTQGKKSTTLKQLSLSATEIMFKKFAALEIVKTKTIQKYC